MCKHHLDRAVLDDSTEIVASNSMDDFPSVQLPSQWPILISPQCKHEKKSDTVAQSMTLRILHFLCFLPYLL